MRDHVYDLLSRFLQHSVLPADPVLRHPKAGLRILPFFSVGNGLYRRDRFPGVVICLGMRSLTADFVASTRVTASSDYWGLVVAAINGCSILCRFLRRSPD